MGKGRKPLPPALRLLTGRESSRGHGKNPPQVESVAPAEPTGLEGDALAQWTLLVRSLGNSKILATIDGPTLEMACHAYATWRKAEAEIAEGGMVQVDEKGIERKRPWVAIAREAEASWVRFSALLGLSPADRARINVPTSNPVIDEFERRQNA